MYVEIQEAVCFLCSFLYDKIPRRRVDMFAERLANLLYSGYADDRQAVDEGSRRVDVKVRGHTDRLILLAADMVQLDKEELLAFLPNDMSVVLGVEGVSARQSTGAMETVFLAGDRDELRSTMQPRLRVKCPMSFYDNNYDVFELSYDGARFTTRSFAMTRFGSLKTRSLATQQGSAGRIPFTTPPFCAFDDAFITAAAESPLFPYLVNDGLDFYPQYNADLANYQY